MKKNILTALLLTSLLVTSANAFELALVGGMNATSGSGTSGYTVSR